MESAAPPTTMALSTSSPTGRTWTWTATSCARTGRVTSGRHVRTAAPPPTAQIGPRVTTGNPHVTCGFTGSVGIYAGQRGAPSPLVDLRLFWRLKFSAFRYLAVIDVTCVTPVDSGPRNRFRYRFRNTPRNRSE